MQNLRIGPKFVLSLGMLATALIVCGLWGIYPQEEGRLRIFLEEEGKNIQAQIEATRAYIAKNYIGKMKKSSIGSSLHVSRDHERDPEAMPFPATATQEIEQEFAGGSIYQARLVSEQLMNPANVSQDEFEVKAIVLINNGADVSMATTSDGAGPSSDRTVAVDEEFLTSGIGEAA